MHGTLKRGVAQGTQPCSLLPGCGHIRRTEKRKDQIGKNAGGSLEDSVLNMKTAAIWVRREGVKRACVARNKPNKKTESGTG